jgi:Zn-dependent peptidase ImmA (M78 family)
VSAVIIEHDGHPSGATTFHHEHELAHVFGEQSSAPASSANMAADSPIKSKRPRQPRIAGELLVPFEAAKLLARRKATDEEVALQFGVSVDLARRRMDATGARLIAQRRPAAYRRASGS